MQEMLCNVSDKRRNHCWSPTLTDSLCLYAVYETQLLVTLKLFNTAMGRWTASQETTPSGEALIMRIDGEPRYTVMLSAVFQ